MVYPFIPLSAGGSSYRADSGEALTEGDLVTLNTAGEIVRATATTASAIWEVIGVASETVGAAVETVAVTGFGATVQMRFSAPPGAATNGSRVFLSTTTGFATLTAPGGSGQTVFQVGVLAGADGVTTTPDVIFQPDLVVHIP